MVGNRFNIESAPEFVNVLSWTKLFRLAQCGKQPLPGATIGVLSVFLVRMMNSRIGFDWRDLEVFVAAAESGSIARAAERCRLAPSAASKRLSDLEAALGAPLLERHNRGVRPTAAGQALLQRSRGLLEEARRIEREVRSYGEGLSGHVRLFANISAIVEYLPAALAQFAKAWPGIRVELEEHVSSEVAQAVAENVADVGVVSDLSDFDGVALHPCWRDQLALLAPAGHPLAHAVRVRFAQALEHPMVGLKPGSTLHSRLLRAAAELGRSLPMQVQVGSFDAMCAMIAAGMGVGIMPRAASLPYLDALRLTATPLDESWAEHQLYLCRKADGELSPAAARLFAHLAAQASPA